MRNPWLFTKTTDLLLLGLPVWVAWIICFIVPGAIHQQELPLWFWVVIILAIDVSHVWSTIFRTYFDKSEFNNHRKALIYTPLLSFVLLFILASVSIALFWTILAYVALYHFIKQQYGFMQLYRAKYGRVSFKKRLSDKFIIYLGMLYPVFFWHINTERHFSWFVEGDFFNLSAWLTQITLADIPMLDILNASGSVLFMTLLAVWLIEELYFTYKYRLLVPYGKILWILTTAFNWFIGIVYFNSDFAFSLTNVVAHGIPYLVLLFYYVEGKKKLKSPSLPVKKIVWHILLMIFIILVLALGEEYLWDMLLFRDNEHFFTYYFNYPTNPLSHPAAQAFAFALLSLPQVTHYVLDGFIWKKNEHNPYLTKVLLK